MKSKGWFLLALSLPILFLFLSIIYFGVNIPYWDDYSSIFGFLNSFVSSTNSSDKIGLLFSLHNEHRIVFNRIILLIYHYIFGVIDLKVLMYIGFTGLIGIIYALFISTRNTIKNYWYFLPVSFLLFQSQYYENIYWAMASLSNFYVIAFTIFSLILLANKNKYNFRVAIVLGGLSIFTQGNGMFVFMCGMLILLLQKRKRDLIEWVLFSIFFIGIYFFQYVKPPHHPELLSALLNPIRSADYFFSFLGSSEFFANQVGVILCIYFVWLTKMKYYKKNVVIYSIFLFFILSAVAATLSRSGFGVEQALSSRYRINSIVVLIVAYLSFIEINIKLFVRKYYYAIGFIVLSIVFCGASWFVTIGAIQKQQNKLLTSDQWLYPNIEYAEKTMKDSKRFGIYDYEKNMNY